MCSPGNKLDRSCSESDLSKVNFDNLTVQDCSSEKKLSFVRKRVLIVEEIIHDTSPCSSRLSRNSSCGRSFPDHLHNLQSFFSTSLVLNTPFNKCDVSNLSLMNTQSLPKVESSTNCLKNYGVVPMEVDFLNSSLKSDDDYVVEETFMDIDMDHFTREGLHNPDNAALKMKYSIQEQLEKRFPEERRAATNDEFRTPFMDVDPDRFTKERSNPESVALKKRYSVRESLEKGLPQEMQTAPNKTEIIPIAFKKPSIRKQRPQHNNFVLILSVCLLLILLYIFFNPDIINFMSVNSDIQSKNIQKDLLEKVYKQKISVNVVVQSLEQRHYWPSKIKILGFIGPTGVGKTFIANIIKKHFHHGLIHELYGIQLSYKSQWEQILTTLKNCCFNLIVIDDLMKKDLTDVFALIHSLPQDQYILVISIFNTQYYDGKEYSINYNDIIEIRDEFDNSGLYHELVVFKEFNFDEVKYWIEEQLKLKNIERDIQEEILKNILEGHIVQYQGLKGLSSKILLELEKYK